MSESRNAEARPDPGLQSLPGLQAHRDGLDGWVFATSPAHTLAKARHVRLANQFDAERHDLTPGVRLLLSLVFNDVLLTLDDLKAATGRDAACYLDEPGVFLEWPREGGWRDRREISLDTQEAIVLAGRCRVPQVDWRGAERWLHRHGEWTPQASVWNAFLRDAQAWWYEHLTGGSFAHAAGHRPLQLLPRAAWARLASKRPQVNTPQADDHEALDWSRVQLQATRARTPSLATVSELRDSVQKIVAQKRDEAASRTAIINVIDRLIPRAQEEGRAQLVVLMGTRRVVSHGGVLGKKLAPRTLAEYLRHSIEPVAQALIEIDLLVLTAEQWLDIYRRIIADAPELQRKKLAAFFEAFHRFLVLCGAEPLQCSLAGRERIVPPAAAIVWAHELELAVQYIWSSDCTDEVKEQAELGLRLGWRVALRIEELWCIRCGDVLLGQRARVKLYPRRRDGLGKSPALRREEDFDGEALLAILSRVLRRRRGEGAGDEDVLLGEPKVGDARHQEELTTRLMNEALRWATGDSVASFHDLRHSRISFLSEPVFEGTSADGEVGEMQQVSAAAGHAGPGSTIAYQHLVEKAIARQAAEARPSAWARPCR